MSKSISAKVETYEKDGQRKNKYVQIGVILNNEHGEYIMLDPTVNLSGILMKQRILAQKENKQYGGNVMCSIFDNDNQSPQQQAPAQQQSAPSNNAPIEGEFDDLPF